MILFILSHIFGDFIFQKNSDVIKKSLNTLKGNFIHFLKITLFYFIGSIVYLILINGFMFDIILIVTVFFLINTISHFLIDLGKTWISNNRKYNSIKSLLIDQLIHIAILIVTYQWLLDKYRFSTAISNEYLSLILFLSVATFVSSVIIREILDLFHLNKEIDSEENHEDKDKSSRKANYDIEIGKWIGIIERTIMFMSLYLNLLGLFTIIVGFKTLSRYDKFKSNPEYYIIGNLLSILFVLISYVLYLIVL